MKARGREQEEMKRGEMARGRARQATWLFPIAFPAANEGDAYGVSQHSQPLTCWRTIMMYQPPCPSLAPLPAAHEDDVLAQEVGRQHQRHRGLAASRVQAGVLLQVHALSASRRGLVVQLAVMNRLLEGRGKKKDAVLMRSMHQSWESCCRYTPSVPAEGA